MSRSAWTLILGLTLLGCGGRGDTPELGRVSGTVTLDGEPLPDATVTFSPKAGGRPSSGVTNSSGRYELKYSPAYDGALIGKHRVQIRTATTKSDENGNDVEVPEKLPAKYNANTELEKEVNPGSNTFDFKLDSKGKVYKEKPKARSRQSSPSC